MKNACSHIRLSMIAFGIVLAMLFAGFGMTGRLMAAEAENEGLDIKITGSIDGGNAFTGSMISAGKIELQFGSDEEGYLANADVNLGDSSLLSLLLKVDQEHIALQIPQAGESVYQVSLEKIQENLSSALSDITGQEGDGLSLPQMTPDITEEEISEALEPVFSALEEHISEAYTEETDADVELTKLGQTVSGCSVFTYQPNAEQISSLMNALADAITDNEALDQLVAKFADYMRSMDNTYTTVTAGSSEEMSLKEAADSLESNYTQLPQLLTENAEAIGQALEESGFTVRIAISEDSIPVLMEAVMEDGMRTLRVAFEMLFDTDTVSFYQGIDMDEELYSVIGTMTQHELGINGAIDLSVGGMALATITYDIDEQNSSLFGVPYNTFTLDAMGIHADAALKAGENEGTDVFTVDIYGLSNYIPSSDEEQNAIDGAHLAMEIANHAQPAAPAGEIVDISDYTQEQLGELMTQIGENISSSLMG